MTEQQLEDWLNEVAKCWENMGLHLGTQCFRDEEDGWRAVMHPLPVEVNGKIVESLDDTIDLLSVLDHFDKGSVDYFSVHNAEITVSGKVNGSDVALELWLYVPEDAKPVDSISDSPSTAT